MARDEQSALTLMLSHENLFKAYNGLRAGHPVGDVCLKSVADPH